MKRIISWTVALALAFCSVACYDDGAVEWEVNQQEARLAALEQLCNRMNTNLNSLQQLISAIQARNCITGLTPIKENDKEIGYTISFVTGSPITIYYGKDGANGNAPVIGIKQDTDNLWYWTLNGSWLTDAKGNKIKAIGSDGTDGYIGKDGVSPQLKIEGGYWYLSTDKGKSWTKLDKATGSDGTDGANGDTMFKSITQDDNYVYFTMADGTALTIPKAGQLAITLSVEDKPVVMPINYDYLEIHYAITSSINEVQVAAVSSEDIDAAVIPDAEKPLEGVIRIRSGLSITDGTKVIIFANNGYQTVMKALYFESLSLVGVSADCLNLSSSASTLTIKYQYNSPVTVSVPESDKTWITILSTKALTDGEVKLSVAENTAEQERETTVTVASQFSGSSLSFTIKQDGKPSDISFKCAKLKSTLTGNKKIDTDGDGEISFAEAQAVTSLKDMFGDNLDTYGSDITSFDEFQYFTGITEIPQNSFYAWTELESITLPESITTIDTSEGQFSACTSLKTIKGKFATEDGKALIYKNALVKVVEYLEEYDIPDGVQAVDPYAFYASHVKEVTLPYSLQELRTNAFSYSNIESISLNQVNSVADKSFSYCPYLTRFEGSETGDVRVAMDGRALIYGKAMVAYATGNTAQRCVIPYGIERLGDELFAASSKNARHLQTVIIPSTVGRIGTYAFTGQSNLEKVYFRRITPPANLNKFVFANCSNALFYVPKEASLDDFKVLTEDGLTHAIRHVMTFAAYINGHEFIELGDGIKWALTNIDANKPYEFGSFFAWGETETKSNYNWSTYKWGDEDTITKYNYTDSKAVLGVEDDVARQNWKGTWRIPSVAEWEAIMENSEKFDAKWVDDYLGTKIYGYLIKSKVAGYEDNCIFIPADGFIDNNMKVNGYAGFYWCNSLVSTNNWYARSYQFSSTDKWGLPWNRSNGLHVRPVSI